jgi:hypothetical protein
MEKLRTTSIVTVKRVATLVALGTEADCQVMLPRVVSTVFAVRRITFVQIQARTMPSLSDTLQSASSLLLETLLSRLIRYCSICVLTAPDGLDEGC